MRRRLQWAAMIHLTSKEMFKPHRCTTLSLHLPGAPGWISGAQDLSFSVYSPSLSCVGSSHLQTKSLVLIRLHSPGESISVFTFVAVTQLLMVFCSYSVPKLCANENRISLTLVKVYRNSSTVITFQEKYFFDHMWTQIGGVAVTGTKGTTISVAFYSK